MKIHLSEPRGFCGGVRRALDIVEKFIEKNNTPVYILHEIVHNEYVVKKLLDKGVKIIDAPEEAPGGSTLVFSAHGVSDEIERRASTCGITVVDATCPLVKRVQGKTVEFSEKGYTILLFGKKGHREVDGILGRVKGKAHLLENIDDARAFIPIPGERYACLSQTTLNATEIKASIEILKEKIPALKSFAEVCRATAERQNSVRELATYCDAVIVIGSEKSSNTRRLCELVLECGTRTVLISGASNLDLAFLRGVENLGIATGASAPEELLDETVEYIKTFIAKNS